MKLNSFLIITIGVCVFLLLYSVMTTAWPENNAMNLIFSTLAGACINIGLTTIGKNKQS